jgi:hypothetical protein
MMREYVPNEWDNGTVSIINKLYRSDGRFWPVDLCCAVVRKSESLTLVNMCSDTILTLTQMLR